MSHSNTINQSSRWQPSGITWGILGVLSIILAPLMAGFVIWVDYQILMRDFNIPLGTLLTLIGLVAAFAALSISPLPIPTTGRLYERVIGGYLHLGSAIMVPLWVTVLTWQTGSFARFPLVLAAFVLGVQFRRWQAKYSLSRPSFPVRVLDNIRQALLAVIVGLVSAFFVGVPVFMPYR